MKTAALSAAALLLFTTTTSAHAQYRGRSEDSARVLVQRVLATTPLVDGHNDLVAQFISGDSLIDLNRFSFATTKGQTDLQRWQSGRVSGSLVTVAGTHKADVTAGVNETVQLLHQLVSQYPDRLTLARNHTGVRAAHAAGKVAIFPHLEGAEQLGGSVQRLRDLHARGLTSVGLTWNKTNDVADAALDEPRWNGLSPFGRKVVEELNDLGIMVDVSHASDATALEAVRLSRAPVILSHSSLRSVANVRRNASDEVLTAVSKAGGIVMVTFVPYFTTDAYATWYERGELVWDSLRTTFAATPAKAQAAMENWEKANPPPRVTVRDVADHLDHARSVVGSDHVGLGSDFDGMYSHVTGLEDVAAFPNILIELATRGWSESDLGKVAGGNVLRVMAAVAAAAKSQRMP